MRNTRREFTRDVERLFLVRLNLQNFYTAGTEDNGEFSLLNSRVEREITLDRDNLGFRVVQLGLCC